MTALAPSPSLDREVLAEEPIRCAEIVAGGTQGDGIECGRPAEKCSECGYGVCDKHNDPCYEKACRLHEACRAEHFQATGHALESATFSGEMLEDLFSRVEKRMGKTA